MIAAPKPQSDRRNVNIYEQKQRKADVRFLRQVLGILEIEQLIRLEQARREAELDAEPEED